MQNFVKLEYETGFFGSTATNSWWMTFSRGPWCAEKSRRSSAPFAAFDVFPQSEISRDVGPFFNGFFQGFVIWVSFIDREGSTPPAISDALLTKVG
jgi:hypothetical protein